MSRRGARDLEVAAAVALAAMTLAPGASAQLLPPAESDEAPPARAPTPFRRGSGILWGDLALRSSLLHVEAPGGKVTTAGGMASLDFSWILNVRSFEEVLSFAGAIGGGGGGGLAGVEGELRGDILFGVRGYVTDEQGPFVRAGAVLQDLRYRALTFSYAGGVVQAGYQVIDKRIAFDAGGQVGGTTIGPLFGGFASLTAGGVVLRTEWQHFLASNGEQDDFVTNSGCVVIRPVFPLCLTAWSVVAGSRLEATYAGVSFGIGGGMTFMHHDGELPPPWPSPSPR
jgi:hypothetical protein